MILISIQCLGSLTRLLALGVDDALAVVNVRLQRVIGLVLGEQHLGKEVLEVNFR
jgi:hypothetical protein